MQSMFFPLPLKTHIIFSIIGIAFLIFRFYRNRHFYYLFFALAIACTFLIYICDKIRDLNYVGILEAFLMGITFFLMYYEKNGSKLTRLSKLSELKQKIPEIPKIPENILPKREDKHSRGEHYK